jgi:hypothetical protein
MEIIRKYQKEDIDLIENFRKQTFNENNNSLSYKNFNPENLKGQIFLFFIDSILASIQVIESSEKYTEENDSCRICRYHILKRFRNCNAGFKMLPHCVQWAVENNFKVVYWTHDINNKTVNALYQHKKIMPGKISFFKDPLYQSFVFRPDLRFITGSVTQYVYAKYLDSDFIWEPKGYMIKNAV